jgi:hypothetical protein
VVAAVHQASETLPKIAGADISQIHTAARAGRLLVPTRSLPDTFDVPHPFTPAPGSRVDILLGAYRDASTASTELSTAVAAVAADVRAPSRILTAAREAVQAGFLPEVSRARRRREPMAASRPVPPGPVERILKDLGVRDPDMLLRASAVDQAGDQMILDAANDRLGRYGGSAPYRDLNKSASAAEVINHLLASGDPRAVAILHPPRPSRARRLLRPDSDRAAASPRHSERQAARGEPEAEAEP